MKVLLVTAEPPLPLGHVSARWFYALVEQMERAGFQINILSACSKIEEIQEADKLFSKKKDVHFFGFPLGRSKGLVGKWQSFVNPGQYQFSPDFLAKYQELVGSCELIHGEQLSTGLVIKRNLEKPHFINVHNLIQLDRKTESIAHPYEQVVRWRQIVSESNTLLNFKNIGAVSQNLVEAIRRIHPQANTQWIPFAVDPQFYNPTKEDREFHFGLVGNMKWRPSLSAAINVITKIWPQIHKQRPSAKLLIAGWDAKKQLAQYGETPGLTLMENVKDIRHVFQKIQTLLYFPEEGSGIKVKILEALLMECAVVTNSTGMEGLHQDAQKTLQLVTEPQAFATKALELMDNPQQRQLLGQQGRQYVIDFHSPAKSFAQLQKIYQRIL